MGLVLKKMSKEYAGLAWKFCVSSDSCENHGHYEQFIRLNAISEQASGRGVTHVLVDTKNDTNEISNDSHIVGFITLRATSLVDERNGNRYVKPALEIAELAVDQKYERNGFGSQLVDAAIYIATKLNDQFVGIQNIVLCADPSAVGFYEKPAIGFGKLKDYYALHDDWNDNCIPMYIKLCV